MNNSRIVNSFSRFYDDTGLVSKLSGRAIQSISQKLQAPAWIAVYIEPHTQILPRQLQIITVT